MYRGRERWIERGVGMRKRDKEMNVQREREKDRADTNPYGELMIGRIFSNANLLVN